MGLFDKDPKSKTSYMVSHHVENDPKLYIPQARKLMEESYAQKNSIDQTSLTYLSGLELHQIEESKEEHWL